MKAQLDSSWAIRSALNLAKIVRVNILVSHEPCRMIEGVERLSADLYRPPLTQGYLLQQSEIEIEIPGSGKPTSL